MPAHSDDAYGAASQERWQVLLGRELSAAEVSALRRRRADLELRLTRRRTTRRGRLVARA